MLVSGGAQLQVFGAPTPSKPTPGDALIAPPGVFCCAGSYCGT